jgi:hypothetical protein
LDKYSVPVNLSDWMITMEPSSSIASLEGPARELAGFSNRISTLFEALAQTPPIMLYLAW